MDFVGAEKFSEFTFYIRLHLGGRMDGGWRRRVVWMDWNGWMNGWVDERMGVNGWVGEWMGEWMGG